MFRLDSSPARRVKAPRYDLSSYDRYLCLKPPLQLLFIMVLLCRDYLLPLAAAAMSFKGSSVSLQEVIIAIRGPFWLLAGLPALVVLYGWMRRAPDAAMVARWAWRFGRPLLTLSIAIGAWGPIYQLMQVTGYLHDADMMAVAVLTLQSIALIYLWLSPRVRDAFRQFPAPQAT